MYNFVVVGGGSVFGSTTASLAILTDIRKTRHWSCLSMDNDGKQQQQRRRLSTNVAMTTAVLQPGSRRRAVPARRSCSAVTEREMMVASAWQQSRQHSLTKRSSRVYRYIIYSFSVPRQQYYLYRHSKFGTKRKRDACIPGLRLLVAIEYFVWIFK